MFIFSYLLEKTFDNRGYTSSFLSSFENFDPNERMQNSKEFCARLYSYKNDPTRPRIVFVPDFDTDGIMSGAIGFAGLAELGFNVTLHVLNPLDGYGFSAKTIDEIMSLYPDARVLITADNGIGCFEGVERAKSYGLDVLITDHHKIEKSGLLPCADLIVNPMQPTDSYSSPYICGANVIYQLLQEYADTYCDNIMRSQIRRLRVFAGIGTISDVMPLLGLNRQLVRDSVSIFRLLYSNGDDYIVSSIKGSPVYCSVFYGLKTLMNTFTKVGKLKSKYDIDEQFFGFYLAPLFNSVKRMDGDMMKAFGLLFGSDKEDCADYLFELNEKRKLLVAEQTEKILNSDNKLAPFIYIADSSLGLGLAGLLATHFMDNSKGPCLVVRREDDGSFAGSGRSPVWYPFLTRCADAPCKADGHEVAFGIHFDNEQSLIDFYEFLQKDLDAVLATIDLSDFDYKPDFIIDTTGNGDTDIDIVGFMEFLDEIEIFKPFGVGFEVPNILLRFPACDAEWNVIGSNKQHLKLRLDYGFEVLVWNGADKISLKDSNRMISLTGHLSRNEYLGAETVQFIGSFLD